MAHTTHTTHSIKKQNVRKRLSGNSPEGDRIFDLIMQRFDKVDADNTAIKLSLANHITDDEKIHNVVEQHQTYWGIAIKSLLGLIAGGFATFLAWLGTR